MVIYFKIKNIFFLFLIIFISRVKFIISEEKYINNVNCKTIFIDNNIIYIINSSNDNKVYKYISETNSVTLTTYDENVNNKDLLKIDEETFAFFGFYNNNFYYRVYKLNDPISRLYGGQMSIPYLNKVKTYTIRCITSNKCILSMTVSDLSSEINGYYVYNLDFNENLYTIITLLPTLKSIALCENVNIQCSFFDENGNFFCIFSFRREGNDFLNFLANGKVGVGMNEPKNLCSGTCFSGNIFQTNESKDKYLVCYEKFNYKLYIYCRYISFEENTLLIYEEYEVGQMTAESLNETPLILSIYDNTIFISFDNKLINDVHSMLLISSLDFKINMLSELGLGQNCKITNFFNNENNYYAIFEYQDRTLIKINSFYKCKENFEYIYFSQNEYEQVDFSIGHESEYITFSLDSLVKLKKDDELISSFKNNFISLNEGKFNFKKIEVTNVLKNYYCYLTQNNDNQNYIDKFSLICEIKLKLCYETCKSCNPDKISTLSEQYCKECNDNYYGIQSKIENDKDGYNCYDKIDNYYKKDNAFYPCNYTCLTCENDNSCIKCKENYYFKVDESNQVLYDNKCFNTLPDGHYIVYDANIETTTEIINVVYKPCYSTCSSCTGYGTYESNNCILCEDDYTHYFYDKTQCTKKIEDCINQKNYWKLERNNIDCLSKTDCSTKNIVAEGENIGQCVDDCQNYMHPFQNNLVKPLYTYECKNQKYCLSYNTCLNYHLKINDNTCKMDNCGDIDIFSPDPYENLKDTTIEGPISIDDKKNDINKRLRIIKILTDEKEYSQILKDFYSYFIYNYINLLQEEISNRPDNKIFLITNTKYENFTITIYPLDIEDYAFEKIFSTYNLGFVNFTKIFNNFMEYEISGNRLILVVIMEYYSKNSAINDVNYFLYSLNENNNLGDIIFPNNTTDLDKQTDKLEILYPLSNYNNSNMESKRNSENLTENINNMYSLYPEIDLSNISDPFYNDICFLFTTDVDTDMTLNDRRNEYYINKFLCENNCNLNKIVNQEMKYPRSLCSCDIKSGISFNSQVSKDNVQSISYSNAKSITCIKEVFSKHSLFVNGIFWIFLIVLIFLIIMLLRYIFFGNKVIKRIVGLYDPNTDINNLKISISSNEDNKKSLYNKNNGKNNRDRDNKNNIDDNNKINKKSKDKKNEKDNDNKNNYNQNIIGSENENNEDNINDVNIINNKDNKYKNAPKKDFAKSMATQDKNKKKKYYSNNEIESLHIEYKSAPVCFHAPPKKKDINKKVSISSKGDYRPEEKDLISNSEPSLFKGSLLKTVDKNTNSDFSFDNYPYDNPVYINNLLRRRNMLENNYLQNPLEYEKFLRMELIRKSLYPLSKIERKKYFHTSEDIYDPSINSDSFYHNKNANNLDQKYKRPKKNKRNNKITKLLGGEDLFDENNELKKDKGNISDNNDIKKFEDNKEKANRLNTSSLFKEEKAIAGDENFLRGAFLLKNSENFLIDEDGDNSQKKGNNKNKDKKRNNKNGKFNKNKKGGKDNKEGENKSDNENDSENDNENNNEKDNENDNNKNKNKKNKNNKKSRDNEQRKKDARNRLLKSIGKNDLDDDDEDEIDEKYKNDKMKTEYDMDEKNRIKAELRKIAKGEEDPNVSNAIFNRNRYNNNNYNKSINSNESEKYNLIKTNNSNLLKLKSKSFLSKKKNNRDKINSSKDIDSNRRMIDFPEEEDNYGDKGEPNLNDDDILKKSNKFYYDNLYKNNINGYNINENENIKYDNNKNNDNENKNSKYGDSKNNDSKKNNSKYGGSKNNDNKKNNSKYGDSKNNDSKKNNSKYEDGKDNDGKKKKSIYGDSKNNNSKYEDGKDNDGKKNKSKYGDSKDNKKNNNKNKKNKSKNSNYNNNENENSDNNKEL